MFIHCKRNMDRRNYLQPSKLLVLILPMVCRKLQQKEVRAVNMILLMASMAFLYSSTSA